MAFKVLKWTSIWFVSCLAISIGIAGCQSLSLESKATATYGSFVVAEKVGAALIQSPNISDAVKSRIKAADANAKPGGDALLEAIIAHRANPLETDQLKHALDVARPAIITLSVETAK